MLRRPPLFAASRAVCWAVGFALASLTLTACGERGTSPGTSGDGAPAPTPRDTAPDDRAYSEAPPLRLPPFELTTLDGATLTDDDLAGRPVVFHFWAPWSQPALADLPVLDSLSGVYAESTLRFVGVLEADGDLDEARALVDSLGLRYPILIDEAQRLARAFDGVTMLPTTFLLDAEGQVVHQRVGRFSSTATLETHIRSVLVPTTSAPPSVAPAVEEPAVEAPAEEAPPQAHALSAARAAALIREGATVYDVRDTIERQAAALRGPAIPAPLATLTAAQLPEDRMRPLLFVSDTSGVRAQLAAEQALAWGHRRVYYAHGDLTALLMPAVAVDPPPDG